MENTSLSLINRLRSSERDPADWRRFINLYSGLLHHWAIKSGLKHAEAEDVVQDVLFLMLEELQHFTHDGRSFRSWLKRIIQNKCVDHCRRRSRQPQTVDSAVLKASTIDPETDDVADKEYNQFLTHRALELMKTEFEETTWRACWETAVEGCSAKEAADKLGISPGTVYTARSRVIKRLREELAGLWS